MIKSFADKHTSSLYYDGKSKRLPPDVIKRALRRLEYVDLNIAGRPESAAQQSAACLEG